MQDLQLLAKPPCWAESIGEKRLSFDAIKLPFAVALIAVAAALLFARLGHYALWDDEADTALFGESILATGDTSAIIGKNIAAYGGGWALTDLHERYIPPLPYYLAAGSMAIFGESAWAARAPFAACGLAAFALILFWLIHDQVDGWTFALTSCALVANVSLILYCRQCRYYAVVILLSVVLAYLYVHWKNTLRQIAQIVVVCTALLATNYIGFAAAAACFAIDWLLWGRGSIRPGWRRAIAFVILQSIIALAFLRVYNPFHAPQVKPFDSWSMKLERAWWDARDLSVNQFWIIPILLAIPAVYALVRRDQWLLRGGVAVAVYFLCVTLVAPHGSGEFSDIRYFCGMIPLTLALEARAIRAVTSRRGSLALVAGLPILCTNILSGSIWASPVSTGSDPIITALPTQFTLASFTKELENPPGEPFSPTAAWMKQYLPQDATVLVIPQYATYPLMFLSPQFVFAWQLSDPPAAQFQALPAIDFAHRVWPQFVVLFGRAGAKQADAVLGAKGDWRDLYSQVQTIPVYGKDAYRPELFLRNFSDPGWNLAKAAVYIYKKK
jgi:hypothetical protein